MISTNAKLWLIAGTCLLFATCGLQTPREGWNKRWGPLVPHKSFPADCSLCHVPERWDVLREDFRFDHTKETGHALEGAHEHASCLRCHNDLGPIKAYTARGCAGCHSDIHRGKLTGECELCHNQSDWRPGGPIAEHARTRFPLFGAHLVAACEQCHVRAPTGDYRSAPTECATCHRDDLAQALSPDHAAQGWTTSCERCHIPIQWKGAGFTHTFFPLSGGHALTDCSRCHTNSDFGGLSPNCISCHQDDRARAEGHDSFPVTCQDCHTINTWEGAIIDHSFFALSGGHAIDCALCHTNGRFEKLPTTCVSCHQDDRARAEGHDSFPVTCQDCHTINTWEGAIVDHSFFALSGGHAIDCALCHTNGRFEKLPTSCVSCHRDDYNNAANHTNFPTTCEDCHNINRWQGARFNHSFPITGNHNLNCVECHTTNNAPAFSCIDCHEHRRSEMDDEHDEVRNYRYESQACLQCHPNGRE